MLLFIMGAFLPLWREVSGFVVDPVEGDPLTRGLLAAGYGVALLLLIRRPLALTRALLRTPWIWLLLLWAFLSATWSIAPEVTLRKAAAVAFSTLYALLLAMEFSPATLLRLLAKALLFALGLSLLFVFLLPNWGIMGDPHPGDWRGIFSHKNMLGHMAALAFLVFGALLVSGQRPKSLWAGGLLLAALALAGSRSATSLVLAIASTGLITLLWLGRGLRPYWPVVGMVFVLSGAALAMVLSSQWEVYYLAAVEALGKDPTLTGRTPLWQVLWSFVLERPWLGYGLGGFWLGLYGPSAFVWAWVGWEPPHGHNGYLDLWLDLGAIGVVLIMIMFAKVFLVNLVRYLKTPQHLLGILIFWLALLVFIVIINLAESNLVRSNNLFWTLFCYVYFASSLPFSKAHKYPNELPN